MKQIKPAEAFASRIHEYYRELGREEKWLKAERDVDYDDLPETVKEANRAAARRIPEVLKKARLCIVQQGHPGALSGKAAAAAIENHIETLAKAEHAGWMKQKRRIGRRSGKRRDTDKKHDCLVPYARLPEREKEKDRNAVRKYPEILKTAGYAIMRCP